jgi:hypothetical protein
MTNETTASQPKSIGDDAQFRKLADAYRCALPGHVHGPYTILTSFIDSRAPAAQASATIQAAPDDAIEYCRSLAFGWRVAGLKDKEWAANFIAAGLAERAATIKEPVMVAETVGAIPPGVMFHGYSDQDEHFGETILDYMRSRGEIGTDDLKEGDVLDVTAMWTQDQRWRVTQAGNPFEVERISPAAPMVADPAGVAEQSECVKCGAPFVWCHCNPPLAATVKAVPSKALDTKLLDALGNESWNLECFDMPTGGDDSDIGWRVVGHHMAEPIRRIVAEVYEDNPRAAIKVALAAPLAGKTGGAQ